MRLVSRPAIPVAPSVQPDMACVALKPLIAQLGFENRIAGSERTLLYIGHLALPHPVRNSFHSF